MFQKIVSLCVTGMILSLLTTPAAAVDAVRTEAGQNLAEQNHPASGSITTKILTNSIIDGKPGDDQRAFENTVDTIYFYTVLAGLKGQSVTHRWSYGGRIIANADIPVTDDPFTTWSSNKMEPNWTGIWTVEVLDRNSKVIGFETFEYNHPRNLQMNPDANKAREGGGDIPAGRGTWGPNHGRGW